MGEQVAIEISDFRMRSDIKEAYVIEFEDALFHHESAVMLPSYPKGPTSKEGDVNSEKHADQKKISGIAVIATVYKYVRKNPNKIIIITGHTDTSGKEQYNFWLSRLRAANVYYLIDNNRDMWVNICDLKHKIEDYQQILKHYATIWGWDCNPGEIDNIRGPETEKAVRQFQDRYNQEFGKNISVDGIVGKETWGAFYDCYRKELASMVKLPPEEELILKFRDPPGYPCGESYPIEKKEKDNYKSQTNRRVEVLFFDQDEDKQPGPCPNYTLPKDASDIDSFKDIYSFKNQCCKIEEECPIYKEGLYDREYIKPEPTESSNWIEVILKDEDGNPMPNEEFILYISGSEPINGILDENGRAKLTSLPPGDRAEIEFPNHKVVRSG